MCHTQEKYIYIYRKKYSDEFFVVTLLGANEGD